MDKDFQDILLDFFNTAPHSLLLIRNPDHFLRREEVVNFLEEKGVHIMEGDALDFRVHYELEFKAAGYPYRCTGYLVKDQNMVLEDMQKAALYKTFHLTKFLPEYPISVLQQANLEELGKLYAQRPLHQLTLMAAQQQLHAIRKQKEVSLEVQAKAHFASDLALLDGLEATLGNNWENMIKAFSPILIRSLEFGYFDQIQPQIKRINAHFQFHLEKDYAAHVKPSNAHKRPLIVSKILTHLAGKHKKAEDKLALMVIDGMAYWQYHLLANQMDAVGMAHHDQVIYSWLPSITQLSRQAIFRGNIPDPTYKQNPQNEEQLWRNFWQKKGINANQIRYDYGKLDPSGLRNISRLAIIFNALDDKMHASTHLADLRSLTENWLHRSKLVQSIKRLIYEGFTVYVTSDHGNIQTRGWRNLRKNEKLGTNQSGSRSARHLEYAEPYLAEDFLRNNPELENWVVREEQTLYLKNDRSFKSTDSIVTHGGSHFLEVLIPFIRIDHA